MKAKQNSTGDNGGNRDEFPEASPLSLFSPVQVPFSFLAFYGHFFVSTFVIFALFAV